MPEKRSPISFMRPPQELKAVDLPHEAPNRPLGQDVMSDGIDALLSAIGLQDGLSEQSSQAGTLGMAGGMLPMGKLLAKLRNVNRASELRTEASSATNLGDKLLREHTLEDLDPRISGIAPTRAELSPEEFAKMQELTSQRRNPPGNPNKPGGTRPAPSSEYRPVPTHTDYGTNAGSEPLSPWLLENQADIRPGLQTHGVREGTSKLNPAEARERAELMNGLVKSSDWPDAVKIAIDQEAKRHPRTLGHVGELSVHPYGHTSPDDFPSTVAGDQWSMQNTLAGKGITSGNPLDEFLSRVRLRETSADTATTVPHELTHVGQQLKGGHKFEGEYAAASQGPRTGNKFEMSADKVGENALKSPKERKEARRRKP